MDSADEKQNDVKPADALGKLSERTRASRVMVVVIAVVGFFVIAFLVGLIARGVGGGIDNAPDIPRVEI